MKSLTEIQLATVLRGLGFQRVELAGLDLAIEDAPLWRVTALQELESTEAKLLGLVGRCLGVEDQRDFWRLTVFRWARFAD